MESHLKIRSPYLHHGKLHRSSSSQILNDSLQIWIRRRNRGMCFVSYFIIVIETDLCSFSPTLSVYRGSRWRTLVCRYARSVVTMSARLLTLTGLWHVMFVNSRFASLAMNSKGRMGINPVHSTRGTRVRFLYDLKCS